MKLTLRYKGGPGSGHTGHAGRPGDVGGSTPGTGGTSFFDLDAEFPTPGKSTGLYKEVLSWGGARGDMAGQAIAYIEAGGAGIIFKSAGEVVGVAAHNIETYIFGESNVLHLNYFATKMPGIGRSSMYHIGQLAKGVGANGVVLVSAFTARGFYDKLGLTRITPATYKWDIDDIEDALVDIYESKELKDDEPEDGVFVVSEDDSDDTER